MATSKPDLTTNGIWGSDNINITDPGATKTKEGWGNEIPPSGVQNWWQERSDEMLNHLNEQGIAVWDSLTDYPVNGWVKGSDGEVYISLQDSNLNQDPTSTPAYWLSLSSMLLAKTSQGRLVKRLTTSGTLTINNSADDKDSAYLTSTEIKEGQYLVFCYGAGGGGGGAEANAGGYRGGGGGGQGGTGYGVVAINSSTNYSVGAGGAGGSSGGGSGSTGGNTVLGSVTGNGAAGAGGHSPGAGGNGNYMRGDSGHFPGISNVNQDSYGANGGGPGGRGSGGVSAGQNGFWGGGGGGGRAKSDSSTSGGGSGGDGYIEIYEWS